MTEDELRDQAERIKHGKRLRDEIKLLDDEIQAAMQLNGHIRLSYNKLTTGEVVTRVTVTAGVDAVNAVNLSMVPPRLVAELFEIIQPRLVDELIIRRDATIVQFKYL